MKTSQYSIYLFLSLFLCSWVLQAQDNELGTETVTVVKSYTPSVADAFKIISFPELNDSVELKKKEIQYSIFSVPVASTFSPEKGKATPVQKVKAEKIYNTSLSAALGNFSNAQVDFYMSRDIDRGDKRLDLALNHLSSRGQIDDTPLNTDFYDTGLMASYFQKERELDWDVKLGLQHQLYNWYGLPENTFDESNHK